MKSIGAMVQQICGLSDDDLTNWESGFVDSIEEKTNGGKDTTKLSEKQVECIERIYNKHFA